MTGGPGEVVPVGFEQLGSLTARQPKSLMRMFGPSGNPQGRNLFRVIACLHEHEGVHLEVKASGYLGGVGVVGCGG